MESASWDGMLEDPISMQPLGVSSAEDLLSLLYFFFDLINGTIEGRVDSR